MRRLFRFVLPGLALVMLALPLPALAGGVSDPAFYVNGELYRTVGTPTDLSGTGAPQFTYDTIYNLGGAQPNVADSAPGLPSFNGGRWEVHAIVFNTDYATTLAAHDTNGNGVLDYASEVEAALHDASGAGATDTGIVRRFVCTVNKVPPGNH